MNYTVTPRSVSPRPVSPARRVRRGALALLAMCAVGAAAIPAGAASAHEGHGDQPAGYGQTTSQTGGRASFKVRLSGSEEVDTIGADANARVKITLNARSGRACYSRLRIGDVLVGGETAPTKLHLHNAAAGANGPVVVDFTDLAIQGRRSGCVTADKALLQSMISSPGQFYVNVHTATFPNGAVRGQLDGSVRPPAPEPQPEPTTQLSASLNGANEVDVIGSDIGIGEYGITVGNGEACFEQRDLKHIYLREDEFTPTNLHIHRGVAGANGPVVVDFTDISNNAQTTGCVPADPALLAEIAGNPSGFYLNFHTISFPKGAMRGQLV
jgi:CHRD domain